MCIFIHPTHPFYEVECRSRGSFLFENLKCLKEKIKKKIIKVAIIHFKNSKKFKVHVLIGFLFTNLLNF